MIDTKITFLGSGSWQGVPAPFGDDEISKSVEWGSKDFRFRTSLLVQTHNGKNILVEVTPDIRLQSWKYKLTRPDAVLVSHWHWDHLFGLLDLDWFAEKNSLRVYGNRVTKEWQENSMGHINVNFSVFESFKTFVIDNVEITPVPVNHVEETHGFIFKNLETGKAFAYLSDFSSIPDHTSEKLSTSDYATIDATYLASDIDDDLTHVQKDQFPKLFTSIDGPQLILTNIGSYQNLSHDDFQAMFSQQTIAYDGMEILI